MHSWRVWVLARAELGIAVFHVAVPAWYPSGGPVDCPLKNSLGNPPGMS